VTYAATGLTRPPAWRERLADGGRLVVPPRVHGYTWAIAFDNRGEQLVSRSWQVCGVVSIQGAGRCAAAGAVLHGGRIRPVCAEAPPPDTSRLDEALASDRLVRGIGVTVAGSEPFDSLQLWLAIGMPGFCRLSVQPGRRRRGAPAAHRHGPDRRPEWLPLHLCSRQLCQGEQPSGTPYEFEIHAVDTVP